MKKTIYLLFIFISCTNYHEDDIIFLDSLIPSFELTLGEKKQNIISPTESSLIEPITESQPEEQPQEQEEEQPEEQEEEQEEEQTEETAEEQTEETAEEQTEEQTEETAEEQAEEQTEERPIKPTLPPYEYNKIPIIYTNWAPGEPSGNQPYVFIFSVTGEWVDHDNILNQDGYGLYQIEKSLQEITPSKYPDLENFTFIGEFNGITYFFNSTISTWLDYSLAKPLNGEASLAIIDKKDINDYLQSQYRRWTPRQFWIGAQLINNEWFWLIK